MLMTTLEVSGEQAQASLDALLDQVIEQEGILVIDRPGKPRVAVLAEQELSGLLETVYLLRSPANARRLFDALEACYADDRRELTDLDEVTDLGAMLEQIRNGIQAE